MTTSGQLKRGVLQVLWDHPDGATAREVIDNLEGPELAVTTVLTVLDRLRRAQLVTRDGSARPHRYFASVSREDYITDLMLDALGQAPDRGAVLSRFLGRVTAGDAAHVRRVLARRRSRSDT